MSKTTADRLPVPGAVRLPTFLIIGAVKCGTTSLAAYLREHPQVFMAEPKELRFFTAHWGRGLSWYADRFAATPEGVARGEASPQYTLESSSLAAERIAGVIPNARLIYLVRDPIKQIVSFHRHLVHKGKETERSLATAVRQNPLYLTASSYGRHLAAYREHFPPDSILVLTSEQLLCERAQVMRLVLEHIGVDPTILPANLGELRNTGDDKLVLPKTLARPRALWRRFYRITGRVPRKWRHTLRSRISKPLPAEASTLDQETRGWVRDRLAKDLELFDRLAPPDTSRWSSDWSLRSA